MVTPEEEPRNSFGIGDGESPDTTTKRPPTENSGTVINDDDREKRGAAIQTNYHYQLPELRSMKSPSRADQYRLEDDLAILQSERASEGQDQLSRSRSRFLHRNASNEEKEPDALEIKTDEKTSIYRPPEEPNTNVGRIFKKVHDSFLLLRYAMYIAPLALILLIPLLLGALLFKKASVGGVKMDWFFIWLEIVWLSLWLGRVSASS
jgi:hypothetical protein